MYSMQQQRDLGDEGTGDGGTGGVWEWHCVQELCGGMCAQAHTTDRSIHTYTQTLLWDCMELRIMQQQLLATPGTQRRHMHMNKRGMCCFLT